MIIQWFGHSCFKIQDKAGVDNITIITDPFDKNIGLKAPSFESQIATISHGHSDHNNIQSLKGNPYVIDAAGEYDIRGIGIQGIESFHDQVSGKERGINIIYRFEVDDISIAHLGDLGHVLQDKQLEALAGIDVLLIPIGGKFTIGAKQASEVVAQIEPRIIIPMHYKIPGLSIDLDDVQKFIKEIGLIPREEEKLKISKKELPQEDMELVILKV